MTVIGKILTLLVFVLSLVFLGFAITINKLNKDPVSKKSWYDVAMANKAEVENARADLRRAEDELQSVRAEVSKLVGNLNAQIANLTKERDDAKDLQAKAESRANEAEDKFAKAQVAVDQALNELKQRRDEAVKLYASMKDKDQQLAAGVALQTRLNNDRIQAQVARDSFAERLRALEKEYQSIVKTLEETREQLARGGLPAAPSGERVVLTPPPDQVQGVVESVKGDLVQVSVGSDQGLQQGHTLEIFRLEPKPEYLGPIRIIKVEPKKSVGKMMMPPQKQKQVQPNDQVASSILTNRG